tara:strand:+ start:329 stop:847 length:519 start_codon:yes stop_codon:yes gene_type:complete
MQKEVVPHKPQLEVVAEARQLPSVMVPVPLVVQVVVVLIGVPVVLEEVRHKVTPVVAQVMGLLVEMDIHLDQMIREVAVVALVQSVQTEPQVFRVSVVMEDQTALQDRLYLILVVVAEVRAQALVEQEAPEGVVQVVLAQELMELMVPQILAVVAVAVEMDQLKVVMADQES